MSEPQDPDRHRLLERLLEMVPGFVSWAIIVGPIWLSFNYPSLVAYFVLSFDFYWLCRALWFAGAVIVAFRKIRRVQAQDWWARLGTLDNPSVPARGSAAAACRPGRPRAEHPGDRRRRGDRVVAASARRWRRSWRSLMR